MLLHNDYERLLWKTAYHQALLDLYLMGTDNILAFDLDDETSGKVRACLNQINEYHVAPEMAGVS